MLLIKNAELIFTLSEDRLEHADILIKDGKIAAIGHDLATSEADVIDAQGLVAVPGLIDAHTHHGGFEVPNYSDLNQDLNEMTDPITPQLNAVHGVDIRNKNFQNCKKWGVTTVCILPGSANPIGGQAFVTKTSGDNLAKMTLRNPCAMKLAYGGNPKGVYGPKNQEPMTRMGVASILIRTFRQAQHYFEQKQKAARDNTDPPAYNDKFEALYPVFSKEIPLKIHCEQFDMLTAIELAQQFDLDYTIEHAWLALEYIDELVEGGGAINYGPVAVPMGYGELTGAYIWEIIELDRRGLCVSIISDAPIYSQESLLFQAGEAVRYGMDHERALRTITINPATTLGVADRVGSLEVGKDADVVLFDGIPALDIRARVIYTLQDGRIVYASNEESSDSLS